MRHAAPRIAVLTLLVPLTACVPDFFPATDEVLGTVAEGAAAGTTPAGSEPPAGGSVGVSRRTSVSGAIAGDGQYQLFDLGPAVAGQEWTVSAADALGSSGLVVVLLDADLDLLMRARVSSRSALRHITRLDSPRIYLGVMPPAGSSGGDFRYNLAVRAGVAIPPPRTQVVYLNFNGTSGARVQSRPAAAFPPFEAALLGGRYADHTEVIINAIKATVRADYAPYNVVVLSSDEGPPPHGVAYSTVHFGGYDSRLLGLADSVDRYNELLAQTAVVYVESFADYDAMQLAPEEMGVMVGNVASHEVGHLLGLYHTQQPDDVMDSTGTAWDLAGQQTFRRAPLEPTVFAVGTENNPRVLEQTVGRSGAPAAPDAKLDTAKRLRYKQIRTFTEEELRCRCGLCLEPDA